MMSMSADTHRREMDAYVRFISDSLERLIACLDGLDAEQLNWHPAADGANSVWVLAVHTLANAEENILAILGGRPSTRDRDAEFRARGVSPDALRERWRTLQPALQDAIRALPSADLDREYAHPRRGTLTGREVLLLVTQHAAEHLGHAEVTRDLLKSGAASAL
jgi:hypothetical protein